MEQGQPEHCTRHRMKPYMSECECEWCKELDALLMERPDCHNGREGRVRSLEGSG